MTRRPWTTLALMLLAACTAGGIPTSSGGAGGVTIDINLTLSQPVQTPYGLSGGFTPAITTIPVGSQIPLHEHRQLRAHGVVSREPIHAVSRPARRSSSSATTQSGNTLSGGFTSGALQAGTSSQTITADRAGTYLFGCFFHYGAPMRGAIVAQ